MPTYIRSITLIAILFIAGFGLMSQATAESLASSHNAFVSELVILKATTWTPTGLMDSTQACQIAKDLALANLGAKLSDLHVVERTSTSRFPSHLTCQWDVTRNAYQTILSIELPAPLARSSLTSDRLY